MWPNWAGETAVIVGTGPSAKDAPLELARGRAKVFVIKGSYKLAPWADALYGLDQGWWIAHQGVPQFQGLKFSPSPAACKACNLQQITLKPRAEILMKVTGVIGCGLRTGGGYSGFQAINLAIQFGARKIILVGFDMSLTNGAHWNPGDRGVGKPDPGRTESWRAAMDGCADQFRSLGVEVLNASYPSDLRSFEKVTLERALRKRTWARRSNGGEDQSRPVESELQSPFISDPDADGAETGIR